jgi:hypothetical protein
VFPPKTKKNSHPPLVPTGPTSLLKKSPSGLPPVATTPRRRELPRRHRPTRRLPPPHHPTTPVADCPALRQRTAASKLPNLDLPLRLCRPDVWDLPHILPAPATLPACHTHPMSHDLSGESGGALLHGRSATTWRRKTHSNTSSTSVPALLASGDASSRHAGRARTATRRRPRACVRTTKLRLGLQPPWRCELRARRPA